MTHSTELSLLENFTHYTALLKTGSLLEEDARRFERDIKKQIESAETLARSIPLGNQALFPHAQNIMGYQPEQVLAFPKPRSLSPKYSVPITAFEEA